MSHRGRGPRGAVLEMVVGPMFSGKSSECMRQYRRQTAATMGRPNNVLVVKSALDTRDVDGVRTHDAQFLCCHRLESLMDIRDLKSFANAAVVLIDEAQFFKDIVEGVRFILSKGISVYVYGLDGDRDQKPFGSICDLLPLAVRVTKLTAICNFCGDDAPFTVSDKDDLGGDQTVPGGSETYSAVCQACLNGLRSDASSCE